MVNSCSLFSYIFLSKRLAAIIYKMYTQYINFIYMNDLAIKKTPLPKEMLSLYPCDFGRRAIPSDITRIFSESLMASKIKVGTYIRLCQFSIGKSFTIYAQKVKVRVRLSFMM